MDTPDILRKIWPVNKVIDSFSKSYPFLFEHYSGLINKIIKSYLTELRRKITQGELTAIPELNEFTEEIKDKLDLKITNRLKPVINATGIILNTNLGRSPLSVNALAHLTGIASAYCNLEYDIVSGKRSERQVYAEEILKELTGAEAAHIVNNNAAAVFLVCSTFAANKEVIVSRGELIEIGGSFRLPEIIAQSSARLVEVGTTNKTYASDYIRAINSETGLLMKSHPSNYKITGFTEQVNSSDFARLGKENQVISFEDTGSGLFIPPEIIGLKDEPYITAGEKEKADLLCFSGDKLLGGPQAGIITGKKVLIDRLKKHPLSRILRIDKLSLAALEATLKLYLMDLPFLIKSVPVLKMLTLPYQEIEIASYRLIETLKASFAGENLPARFEIIRSTSMAGGGSFPEESIDTPVIAISPLNKTVATFARELRLNELPVIGRIEKDRFLINLRTVQNSQLDKLAESIRNILI